MDVVVGEVVGPDGGLARAGLQVDLHQHLAAGSGPPGRGPRRRRRCGRPARRSWTRSAASGSKAASVVPTAESTRPQLGSLPKMAVLNRLERATARLTSSASRSLAALKVRMAMSWLAPSASRDQLPGQVGADRGQAGGESSVSGTVPEAPGGEQHHGVIGGHAAVGVGPVEGDPGGLAQGRLQRRRLPASASVVRTTSMVASPGASMPAPLAMPPIAVAAVPAKPPAWTRCRWS